MEFTRGPIADVVVKSMTDDFFVRTNTRFLWSVIALLVAFGERRLRQPPDPGTYRDPGA